MQNYPQNIGNPITMSSSQQQEEQNMEGGGNVPDGLMYAGSPTAGHQYASSPVYFSPSPPPNMMMGGASYMYPQNSAPSPVYYSLPQMSQGIPQFVAPQFSNCVSPAGYQVSYLPPTMKKPKSKKKTFGCC